MSEPLAFVSTRFLFPVDSGGKIRTTQILRGMKGGRFGIRLVSAGTAQQAKAFAGDLRTVCDEFELWPAPDRGRLFHFTRARHLLSPLPIPVRTDWSRSAQACVRRNLAGQRVAVFDFLHAAVLAPDQMPCPTVLFTHNVEAEIFERHARMSKNAAARALWNSQARKMRAFERAALRRFDVVVAVSDRDAEMFAKQYEVERPVVIPTGVDLDYFNFCAPSRDREVVFCGSMDWMANQEAIGFFLDEVWSDISARVPDARMTVIGRAPPASLVQRARRFGDRWRFTGFVDDVRPYLHGAAVAVIPIRIGGGTRLKVYESMAAGTPVVSTTIGVEGLPLGPGQHYLRADEPREFASAVVSLLTDQNLRHTVAREARDYVESRFSFREAARVFESACDLAIRRRGRGVPAQAVDVPDAQTSLNRIQ